MDALRLVGDALRLDQQAFRTVLDGAGGTSTALWLVGLAGLSAALGQSVGLFVSRVRPRRFVASLLVSAVIFLVSYLSFTASVWLVAGEVFGTRRSFADTAAVIGLGYAPFLFSFFALTPYFGSFIWASLSIWSLLATLIAIRVGFDLGLGQALVCAALGWILLQLLQRSVGRPVQRLARWLRRTTAGTQLVSWPPSRSGDR